MMSCTAAPHISSCHAELMLVAHQAGAVPVTMDEFVRAARLRGEDERYLVEAQVRYLTDQGLLHETGSGYSLAHWGDIALDGAARVVLGQMDEVTDLIEKGLDVEAIMLVRMLRDHPGLTRAQIVERMEAVGTPRAVAIRQIEHLSRNDYGPPFIEGKRRYRLGALGWRLLDVMSVEGTLTLKV